MRPSALGKESPVPCSNCVPLGRELSLAVEPKPKPIGLLFHMFFPHGDACDERSESVPLSETPPVKSRDRVWTRVLVWHICYEVGKAVRTLLAMAAMLRLRTLDAESIYTGRM